MNIEEAENLVKPLILGSTITKTEDFGDLFAVYFVNDEFYASKKMEDMMVGAGPMMVEKSSRVVFATGSGQSAREYSEAYNECGSVYGIRSSSVSISGAADDKSAILNLKSTLSIGTKEAKELVSSIHAGNKVELDFDSPSKAEQIVKTLRSLGVSCKQLWSVKC